MRLRAAVLALALAVAACQTESPSPSAAGPTSPALASPSATSAGSASPSPSPTVTASGGTETSIFDIEPGDCFTADMSEIVSVGVVDCDEPHVYEAFAVFDHEAGPDEAYPGEEAMADYAESACQPPFEEYVGTPYQESAWYLTMIPPTTETWAEGDPEIICTLHNEEETQVTGSAQGSNE